VHNFKLLLRVFQKEVSLTAKLEQYCYLNTVNIKKFYITAIISKTVYRKLRFGVNGFKNSENTNKTYRKMKTTICKNFRSIFGIIGLISFSAVAQKRVMEKIQATSFLNGDIFGEAQPSIAAIDSTQKEGHSVTASQWWWFLMALLYCHIWQQSCKHNRILISQGNDVNNSRTSDSRPMYFGRITWEPWNCKKILSWKMARS